MTVLHICPLDKFVPPFIKFVRKHFGNGEHLFLTYRDKEKYAYQQGPDSKHIESKFTRYFIMLYYMYKSERIVLHGLFDKFMIIMLALQPWLLKKCYWLIWGYDLYAFEKAPDNIEWKVRDFFRKIVIRNVGYLVTSIDGDFENAVKWYGAKGKRISVFTYPSALYQQISANPPSKDKVQILLGNSADPSNNHNDALDRLVKFKDKDIEIYCPLSYGDNSNAQKVLEAGIRLFGDKFIPLTGFMAINEYNEFLSKIDIVIFNHDRQQAMSSARVLLGMGKKLYMRKSNVSYQFFEEKGIKVHPIEELDLEVEFKERNENVNIIKRLYSEETLVKNLELLFTYK